MLSYSYTYNKDMTEKYIPLLSIIIIACIFFYLIGGHKNQWIQKITEGMTNQFSSDTDVRCPNVLIQKGAKYFLYNSTIAQVPGVNPIEFNDLEEYTEFLEWQRRVGIRCPVLFLQHTYDAQGKRVYKIRPSVSDPQGGLNPVPPPTPQQQQQISSLLVDATHDDGEYNSGGIPGYDQSSQYVGETTPLDVMDSVDSGLLYSDNPMSDNWAGAKYTQALVDAGQYKDNEVSIQIP